MAGLPGRAGASNEIEFPREIPGQIDSAATDLAMDVTERTYHDAQAPKYWSWIRLDVGFEAG